MRFNKSGLVFEERYTWTINAVTKWGRYSNLTTMSVPGGDTVTSGGDATCAGFKPKDARNTTGISVRAKVGGWVTTKGIHPGKRSSTGGHKLPPEMGEKRAWAV